jgi:hypothetical protein
MANLKLGKLPDRTPVKINITVGADLNQALRDYATLYRATSGEAESVRQTGPPHPLSPRGRSCSGVTRCFIPIANPGVTHANRRLHFVQ